jgi:hypothetical protein
MEQSSHQRTYRIKATNLKISKNVEKCVFADTVDIYKRRL